MSIAEKRSPSQAFDYEAGDGDMSATTSICVALTVALIVYVLGSAIYQQEVVAAAPQLAGAGEMSFHGP
jgi:hypothetical protein